MAGGRDDADFEGSGREDLASDEALGPEPVFGVDGAHIGPGHVGQLPSAGRMIGMTVGEEDRGDR